MLFTPAGFVDSQRAGSYEPDSTVKLDLLNTGNLTTLASSVCWLVLWKLNIHDNSERRILEWVAVSELA